MPDASVRSCFVLLGGEVPVRRIVVTNQLQEELQALFDRQLDKFLSPELEEVSFDPGFAPDDSQIVVVDSYELPSTLWRAIEDPLACPPLRLDDSTADGIRGVFTGQAGTGRWLSIQTFDRRQLITTDRLSLIFARNTFQRLRGQAMTLGVELAAHVKGKKLYFKSHSAVKRVLDLSDLYKEATDKDLKEMARLPRVFVGDEAAFLEAADAWTRRKIASIRDSRILETQAPKVIAKAAHAFGVSIQVGRKNGKDCIQLPAGKRELKAVLRFVDQDYWASPLTGTKFVSNSKHALDGSQRPERKRPGK